jgi:hypothetical protein
MVKRDTSTSESVCSLSLRKIFEQTHMRLKISTFPFALLTFLVILISSCKNEQKNQLPNTPEGVVVAWQRYIDLNLLDSARLLSTAYTQGYINYLDSLSLEENLEADYNPIIGLSAKINADTAVCDFFFEDELSEKVPAKLILIKENGQWKVDQVIDVEVALPDTLNTLEEQEMFQDSLLKD